MGTAGRLSPARDTNSQAWGPEHSFLRSPLVPSPPWRLLGPLPSSPLPPTPPGGAKSPARRVDVGAVCVVRPERPPPLGTSHHPNAHPTHPSSSLHSRLQHSFPPQMRCYVLTGAAKAWSPAGVGRGPLGLTSGDWGIATSCGACLDEAELHDEAPSPDSNPSPHISSLQGLDPRDSAFSSAVGRQQPFLVNLS